MSWLRLPTMTEVKQGLAGGLFFLWLMAWTTAFYWGMKPKKRKPVMPKNKRQIVGSWL